MEGSDHDVLKPGDYVAVDLDENNRHMYPDTDTNFGWGVCRHGHGLLRHDGVMSELEARTWAGDLNRVRAR